MTRLVKEGHDVTVLHRKPGHALGPKVGELVADRNDAAALAKAIGGRTFDVVFDNVYDWERGTTAAQVDGTARAFGDKLHRYVFISSVAAYGGGLNHYEGDGLAGDDCPDVYARNLLNATTLFQIAQQFFLFDVRRVAQDDATLRIGHIDSPGGHGLRAERRRYPKTGGSI